MNLPYEAFSSSPKQTKDKLSDTNTGTLNASIQASQEINLTSAVTMPDFGECVISENGKDYLRCSNKFIKNYTERDLDSIYDLQNTILEGEAALLNERLPYFQFQIYIDTRMRVILIDWIMEVCSQLSFKRATYHLAVVLVDIFLSKNSNLETQNLQILGVTCLIIAAKSEVFKLIIFIGNTYS